MSKTMIKETCPMCHSTDITDISGTDRGVAQFNEQVVENYWTHYCNSCNRRFIPDW